LIRGSLKFLVSGSSASGRAATHEDGGIAQPEIHFLLQCAFQGSPEV
jgi:hypothetical protein